MATQESDYGAFIEKFKLQPTNPSPDLPLHGLTFAVKDIFDMEGRVTGFGHPDWARTHSAATTTAPAVLAVLNAGATCVGKTIMDDLAYSIDGENIHYGTPVNPCAPDRVPGGSSSGSAVAVATKLADFSLGTDSGGSVRVPAAYCGIFGFRPSHGVISASGVVPLAQSFDTVGWFARDPVLLKRIGKILLPSHDENPMGPSHFIIAEDCFQLSSFPWEQLTKLLSNSAEKLFGGDIVKHTNLGEYVEAQVPSPKHFMTREARNQEHNIPSLAALSSAMRSLERHEFKKNHAEWVNSVQPKLTPGISKRVWEAVNSTDENIDVCRTMMSELHTALSAMLADFGILAIPTVHGAPPKLNSEPTTLEIFRAKAFSLLSIAVVSGFCQVSVPLGTYDNLPVAVSFMAKHGSDGFLLKFVEDIYGALKEQAQNTGILTC